MPSSHLQIVTQAAKAKSHLKATGWTYRSAAVELGVTAQHISYVLNGQRESQSLTTSVSPFSSLTAS